MRFDIEFTEKEKRKLDAMADRSGADAEEVVAWILDYWLQDYKWVTGDPFEKFIAGRKVA